MAQRAMALEPTQRCRIKRAAASPVVKALAVHYWPKLARLVAQATGLLAIRSGLFGRVVPQVVPDREAADKETIRPRAFLAVQTPAHRSEMVSAVREAMPLP